MCAYDRPNQAHTHLSCCKLPLNGYVSPMRGNKAQTPIPECPVPGRHVWTASPPVSQPPAAHSVCTVWLAPCCSHLLNFLLQYPVWQFLWNHPHPIRISHSKRLNATLIIAFSLFYVLKILMLFLEVCKSCIEDLTWQKF